MWVAAEEKKFLQLTTTGDCPVKTGRTAEELEGDQKCNFGICVGGARGA